MRAPLFRSLRRRLTFIFGTVLIGTSFWTLRPSLAVQQPPSFADDHVIVKLAGRTPPGEEFRERHRLAALEKLLDQGTPRGRVKSAMENAGLDRLYIATLEGGQSPLDAVESLRGDALVEYAEPDYTVTAAVLPNDPFFGNLWGMHNTGQTGGTADADVDAPAAWDTVTGSPMVVGLIDSGVDYTHPDLAGAVWQNPGEIAGNGVDDDSNGYIDDVRGWDWVNNDNDPMDDESHGTHVAGTIAAAGNNGIGVAGVNWSGKVAALKFLNASNQGSYSNAIKAIQYANTMGFKITNNSWLGSTFSLALSDAITESRNLGNLFVAAAGNAGNNSDVTPLYPAAFTHDNIISVAATDHNDLKASFSNYGAVSVDLGAPGASVYSTMPSNSYGYKSGTSMATPHVTGAAALLWGSNPSLTYTDVKNQILLLGNPLLSLQGVTVTGKRLNIANLFTTECQRGTPAVTIAPTIGIGAPGDMLTYTVTVLNTDIATCAPSPFSVSPTLPPDLTQSPVGFGLTISPGATGQQSIAVTSSPAAAEGTYPFLQTVTHGADGSLQSTGSASYIVRNDPQPPTVSITAPANGALLEGNVTVTASASDNVGVTRVEFFIDGALASTDTTIPYDFPWNTTLSPDGNRALVAKAYDAAGNVGTSPTVTVTVDNLVPTVTIVSPVNGSTVPRNSTVNINALASDAVAVARVEFRKGSTLLCTDTASPYFCTWNTGPKKGAVTLSAQAFDTAGHSATHSISVSVVQ